MITVALDKGLVMLLIGYIIFYKGFLGVMAFVVFGKLIGLSQLVYWLKPINASELYLFMSSYLATITHLAQIRGQRRMFYNMSQRFRFAVGRGSTSHLQIPCYFLCECM